MRRANFRGLARIIIGIIIAGVFGWLAFRRTDWAASSEAISKASPSLLALAVVSLAIDYQLRIVRWWLMIRELSSSVPLSSCVGPFLASTALNNVLPLRAGDVIRTVAFTEKLKMPAMNVLGTLLIERLLDLTSLILFFFIAVRNLSQTHIPPAFIRGVEYAATVGLAVLIIAGTLSRPLLTRLQAKQRTSARPAGKFTAQLLTSLDIIRSPVFLLKLAMLSILIWLFEGLVFLFVGASLHLSIPPVTHYLALTMGTLATLIPGSPGYVGTFDYFARLALGFQGVAAAASTSYVLTVHLVLWLPLTVTGLGCLYFLRRKKQEPVASAPRGHTFS